MGPAMPEELLIAMLPPFGPQARWMATAGVLKLSRDRELLVERSTATFFDDRGGQLAELDDAFGLRVGTRLEGPLYARQSDARARPPAAASMCWTLNDWRSPPVATLDAEPGSGRLVLRCLPLHVPVPDDRQLVVQLVNTSAHEVELTEAVRTATLWVDGVGYRSMTGWHWDGRSTVPPGGWTRQAFRMGDFDGAPLLGDHVVSIELLGQRTSEQAVQLVGEPWQPAAPASS